MELQQWLKQAVAQLNASGIATSRLDSLVLLSDAVSHNKAWVLANPTYKLTRSQVSILKKLLNRRVRHEPIAYLRGKTEFYGREFIINNAVLEPRPETETMIDNLLKLVKNSRQTEIRLADVGCGSGAIGITAALELPQAHVDLLEIDPKAIKVAKLNVRQFNLNLPVINSNLLKNTQSDYDMLLCNLPYVPDNFHINLAASHEPRLAIFGGVDGLKIYRKLFDQIASSIKKPTYILTEALPIQHAQLADIANRYYDLAEIDDFIQVFKLR